MWIVIVIVIWILSWRGFEFSVKLFPANVWSEIPCVPWSVRCVSGALSCKSPSIRGIEIPVTN